MMQSKSPLEAELRQAYIELVKKSVGDFHYQFDQTLPGMRHQHYQYTDETGRLITIRDYQTLKDNGLIGPIYAHTMIGLKRLNNIQTCVEAILENNIPGDLLEAGVWRGGACIFMRALLKAYGIEDRNVWLADSFQGFPPEIIAQGRFSDVKNKQEVAVSLAQVQAHFEAYDLWDDQVKPLPGYFADTLPQAPVKQLALLRIDADLYESTQTALTYLYPRLVPGGYCIIDDYHAFLECAQAVEEYRSEHGIIADLIPIDPIAVYWQKPLDAQAMI